MSFYLRILAGKNQGEEYALVEGENLIGRSRSAHIRVYNEDVSGKHFVLELTPEGAVVHNISTYGTLIDGVEVQKDSPIRPGQVISAGRTLKLMFYEEKEQEDDDATSVTKLLDPNAGLTNVENDGDDDSDKTAATRMSSTLTGAGESDKPAEDDTSDQTSVTKFASDTQIESGSESKTSYPSAGKKEDSASDESGVNSTQETQFESILQETSRGMSNQTQVPWVNQKSSSANNQTKTDTSRSLESDERQTREQTTHSQTYSNETSAQSTSAGTHFTHAANTMFNDSSAGEGEFFDEEEDDVAEKTHSNETEVVGTRMASTDEINQIKSQIKRQQQSRFFFKMLVFALLIVLLGIVWKMKAPQNEKILSWPTETVGTRVVFLSKIIPNEQTPLPSAWVGYDQGGFSLYYPDWGSKNRVESSDTMVIIHTYLGKKGDVPLEIILTRDDDKTHVYENRETALRNALKRLSERKDESFNFPYVEPSLNNHFFVPDTGQPANGIPYDLVQYQREQDESWFGILRFFRQGSSNYILRAEVPAQEKDRALSILENDTFLSFHQKFVRLHWEGNEEFIKSNMDPERMIISVRDKLLNRNSKMEYPTLEREIQVVLAQSLINDQTAQYKEAMELLQLLRDRQQVLYNDLKRRWFSADDDKNDAAKDAIRKEGNAIFSNKEDKRRYDILRDSWGVNISHSQSHMGSN